MSQGITRPFASNNIWTGTQDFASTIRLYNDQKFFLGTTATDAYIELDTTLDTVNFYANDAQFYRLAFNAANPSTPSNASLTFGSSGNVSFSADGTFQMLQGITGTGFSFDAVGQAELVNPSGAIWFNTVFGANDGPSINPTTGLARFPGLTASRLVSTDASKNLSSSSSIAGNYTWSGTQSFSNTLRLNNDTKFFLGTTATDSYIRPETATPSAEGIYFNATDATISRMYFTATNDMRFITTVGPTYMQAAGGFYLQETTIGNTLNVDSIGINVSVVSGMTADRLAYINSSNYLVSAATINGNYQWDGTQTIDLTSSSALVVRRNASGGNVMVVDTTNRQVIFGAGDANDVTLYFDGTTTSDGTIRWDVSDQTFYIKTNSASDYLYPTYGAAVSINTLVSSGTKFALQAWATMAAGAGAAGGFWGGYTDSGSSAVGGEVYGLTAYNYFAATTARSFTSIFGNYVGNEFSVTTQITATTLRGLYVTAGEGGGTIKNFTDCYGIEIAAPGFTATDVSATRVYYGLRIGTSSVGAINYSIFLNSTGVLAFRNQNHQIASPSAGVLRLSSNTSFSFNIGSFSLGSNSAAMTLTSNLFTLLDSAAVSTYFSISPTALTFIDAQNLVFGTTTGTKIGTGTTQKIGFWNATPVVQNTGWGSITNVTTDRAYDANATTTDELADVLGTLIAQLVTYGILGA